MVQSVHCFSLLGYEKVLFRQVVDRGINSYIIIVDVILRLIIMTHFCLVKTFLCLLINAVSYAFVDR